ncbi:formate dehydrogenase subunit gamma [Frigidibacter oleivorans]|uniref:formate dehydrogenase subunit gamma n=1 Tax=Frigidibacter oleivorans TaxID=2487129 RepID=UPI000F8C5BCB|nr:formate dehydrogenase subunit gamma [Frigidibacter oleivorans]
MTIHPGPVSVHAQTVADILERHQGQEGALLPILHDVQEAVGFIPPDVLPQIARALLISDAEIHGVVTFYHDFRQAPAGRHVLRLCRAEACQAMGGEALADHARERLGIDWHETTPDGRVTLEPVFCLGLCACGPAAMVDDRPVARLDAAALDRLVGGMG